MYVNCYIRYTCYVCHVGHVYYDCHVCHVEVIINSSYDFFILNGEMLIKTSQ